MQVIQVKLQCENNTLVTFVDKFYKKKPIKVGNIITLKDDKETLWEVIEMFAETDSSKLHTDWNNNI